MLLSIVNLLLAFLACTTSAQMAMPVFPPLWYRGNSYRDAGHQTISITSVLDTVSNPQSPDGPYSSPSTPATHFRFANTSATVIKGPTTTTTPTTQNIGTELTVIPITATSLTNSGVSGTAAQTTITVTATESDSPSPTSGLSFITITTTTTQAPNVSSSLSQAQTTLTTALTSSAAAGNSSSSTSPHSSSSSSSTTTSSTAGASGTAAAGTGGQGELTGSCADEGAWNCIGGTSFQRCASGLWSAVLDMAAGTECTPGISTTLTIARRQWGGVPRRRRKGKVS
ncbi:hypothetical protein BX600DRAFT_145662 [Xylariales sp. PMI_506]|nr:hypothetical protein BX600DRAFT_145662 [Xylariales sp. PMI_506]